MKWEYKTVVSKPDGVSEFEDQIMRLEHELNKLGKDGWEMVSSVSCSAYIAAILKRVKN
jgi:hypothetical protein